MTKRKRKKKSNLVLPTCVLELAKAFKAGEDCGFALHDALLEAGHSELADHFQGDCKPNKRCTVVEYILRPGRFDVGTGELTPLRFCLDMHLAGVFEVTAAYNGEGDSGGIDDVAIDGPGDLSLDDEDWDKFARHHGYRCGVGGTREIKFDWVLDSLVSPFPPQGYENNEGGHGTFTFNCQEGTGELEHTWHEYEAVDDSGDSDDEDYETELVNGESFTRQYDFLEPTSVESLEFYDSIAKSNAGSGNVHFRDGVPTIERYVGGGSGKRGRTVSKKIIWAVMGDGRIYDPTGAYRKKLEKEES